LQLQKAVCDRAGPRHHLDQVVHVRTARVGAVLLGEQRRGQLRPLQLVPLLREQGPERHRGRGGDPAPRSGGGLGGEPLALQPAQRPYRLPFGQRQAVRQLGGVGGAEPHQRAVRRFLHIIQTDRGQQSNPLPVHPSGMPWRKPATAYTRRAHLLRINQHAGKGSWVQLC
jgi:hypothetical protein